MALVADMVGDRRAVRTGQSLTEFALVVPLLTLAIVGTISLGMYLYARLIVTTAAQEGARVASSAGRSLGEGRQLTRQWLDRQLGDWAGPLVIQTHCQPGGPPVLTGCSGPTITLSISGSLPLALPPLLVVAVPIDIAVTMHREGWFGP